MGFLSSVYHLTNPETAGMTAAFAAHSTQILPIITITDMCAWLVRHSIRHCVHMKSVDSRFSLISSHWGQTKKMFPVMAEEYSSLSCNKVKNSLILLQTNQQRKLVSNTAVVWENVQDNNCQLSVHRTNCLISTFITQFLTSFNLNWPSLQLAYILKL